MKRITLIILAVAAIIAGSVSCQKVNDLDKRLTELEQTVSELKAQILAGAVITSVDKTADGCTFTLSNGQSFTVTNGKDGSDGEAIIADVEIEENFIVLTLKNGETLRISYQNPLSMVTLNIVPDYDDGTVGKPETVEAMGMKSHIFYLDISVTPAKYTEILSDTERFIHKAVFSPVQTKSGFGNAFTVSPKRVTYCEGAPIPFLETCFELDDETASLLLNNNSAYTVSYVIEDKDGVHGAATAFVTISHEKSSGGDVTDISYVNGLPGVFSVSNKKKVRFSPANLVCSLTNSLCSWNFLPNQYEFDSGNNVQYLISHITLFTWGYNSEQSINPRGTADNNVSTIYGDLTQDEDWGSQIGDGRTWYTLSRDEWQYLFSYGSFDNSARRGKYKCGVNVCGRNCVVLLPDNWKWEGSVGTGWQEDGYPAHSTDNVTWKVMEEAGAVCLPAAGYRKSGMLTEVGTYGYYWSSSAFSGCPIPDNVSYVRFSINTVEHNNNGKRGRGYSVRLVRDAKVR